MRPLCVTMGEPAGIGGEIALKAWQRLRRSGPPFVVLDDPARLRRVAADLALDVPVRIVASPPEASGVFGDALPVWPLGEDVWADPGRPRDSNCRAVIAAIERAVSATQSGEIAGVVTNPIHKAVLSRSGFAHPGNTDFLAALAGVQIGRAHV